MKHYFLLLLLIGCIASGRAESGWKAHWINTERCQSATNTWLAFRKTVHIDKVPQTLTARIAADSKYWLWINGRLVVFEGGLKRGPSLWLEAVCQCPPVGCRRYALLPPAL